MSQMFDAIANAFRGKPVQKDVADVLEVTWRSCFDEGAETEDAYKAWALAASSKHTLTVAGATLPVRPIRFSSRQQLVSVRITFGKRSAELTAERLTVEVEDKVRKKKKVLAPHGVLVKPTHVSFFFRVSTLLEELDTDLNLNAFSVAATFTDAKGVKHEARTAECAHVLLQKALVLLPGVMASELHFAGNVGGNWPSPFFTADRLREAGCGDDGVPRLSPSKVTVIKKPGSRGPYHLNKWNKLLNHDLPVLKRVVPYGSDEIVPYITLHEYPYDWRRACKYMVDRLLDLADTPFKLHDTVLEEFERRPTYTAEPPLAVVRKLLRRRFPYLDDKLAMAGHSTGGVILNGLIRAAGAENIIGNAFLIGTPFRGATKPYLVALRGTMLLGGFTENLVLDPQAMVHVGARLPVLYHLAPTKRYEQPVMKIGRAAYRATDAVDGDGHFVNLAKAAVRAKGLLWHHSKSHDWRTNLRAQATAYHDHCEGALRIPEAHCTVFYSIFRAKTPDGAASDGEKPCTLGTVVVDPAALDGLDRLYRLYESGDLPAVQPGAPRTLAEINEKIQRALTFELVDGDGTVPLESLLGGAFAAERHVEIGAGAHDRDHVEITAAPELWQRVQGDIMEEMAARARPRPAAAAARHDAPAPSATSATSTTASETATAKVTAADYGHCEYTVVEKGVRLGGCKDRGAIVCETCGRGFCENHAAHPHA